MSLQVPKTPALAQGGQSVGHAVLDPVVEFYQLLSSFQVVEALYAEWHRDGLEIWLVVNGATETDRKRVYEQEWALMQSFPGLGLDVHLLDRQQMDPGVVTNLDQVDVFLRFPQPAHA